MTEAADKAALFLESSVKNFKIFIDTCSLLDEREKILMFWNNIVPILQRENKSIIIPLRVYEEVQKFANNPDCCRGKMIIQI